jgi:trimethylamine--corrinoid protein Co-methyltransferase
LNLRFLDKAEEDVVHEQSVECLETIGVLVHSQDVLRMLADAGADVDFRKKTVKISESMVDEAIKGAPKTVVLGARDPRRTLKLPVDGFPYVSTGGVTLYMTDLESGEPRKASRKDLADFARLSDALESIDAFWPIVTTSDVPPHAQFVQELWVSLQNTTKHILGSAGSATLGVPDARAQIALGALVAGGLDMMRKRPPFSVLSCIAAPLSFETGAVEAQVEYARAGIPIISMSMCMGGMTSPVTVAGTIVTSNAENLASLVITQTAAPGAPQIYCSESTLVNMSTGYIGYRGVEAPMLFVAASQMARRYRLPKMAGVVGVDAERPGVLIPFGELAALMLTTMSGTDLCSGIGGLELDRGCSLEQVVIDAAQWEEFRGFMRRFAVTEEAAALDVIKDVGQGNTFINHPHTAKNFRSQMFFRSKGAGLYGATMSDGMVADAREIVRKTLREHTVESLDKDVLAKGNAIVSTYGESPVGSL